MKVILPFFIFFLNLSFGQDTILISFNSEYHLKHDYRDYSYELENCVVFKPNIYHCSLPNGVYGFKDSISGKTRLKGDVQDGKKNGKWCYYDTKGVLRIEDIFLNDANSGLITNYFSASGILFRTKESSKNFLRTTHYNKYGIESYYYHNYLDSNNVQMSFDSLGNVIYQSAMYNGKKHGIYYWQYDDGTLYAKHYYENGNKEGMWLQGLKGDTVIWCTKEYINDKLISISFYGKNRYTFEQDETEVIDYYENGTIRLKGIVSNGYVIGDWIFYDSKGNKVAKFKHDEKGNITIIEGPSTSVSGI